METKRMVCPRCEALRDIAVEHRSEDVKVRKDTVSIDAEFCVCRTCGADFVTSAQMESNLEAARRVYRERRSIIQPREIVALRERFDISQKAFAKLLDIGELTINSYEQGVLPSGAHNSLLRLAEAPENFRRLYSSNKERLSDRQREKVERAMAALVPTTQEEHECLDERDDVSMVVEAEAPYHGRTTRELSRMFDVIQLILAYARRTVHKMSVLKLLFYVDFSYFRLAGQSITGWNYARLPYGPVPDDYKRLLYQGEKCGKFTLEPDDAALGEIIALPDGFDRTKIECDFSPTELATIRKVVEKLGFKSAAALRDLSHEEQGWIETPHAQDIPYCYAATLKHGV